jgi:cytochrome P450 family 26 subfamily A
MNGGRTGEEGMLPPGSRGLPLLGETLEFFAASPTLELVPFFKRRLERYMYIYYHFYKPGAIGPLMIFIKVSHQHLTSAGRRRCMQVRAHLPDEHSWRGHDRVAGPGAQRARAAAGLQEERGFQIWYPSSFMRILGANNMVSMLGPLHRHIRNLVLRLFGPEALRLVLLHDVQRSARDELRSWLDRPDVEVRTATSRVSSL